jgi:hypothetical protein
MKTLFASFLMLTAGSAAAHSACNMELAAGLRITDKSIEFYKDDKQAYKILEDKYLVVKGSTLKLSQPQQDVVANYAASIRAAVPEVHGMAVDGIDLAIEAITITFDSLLGEKNQISAQLATELSNLKSDVNRYFSSGDAITFNHGSDGIPDFLGKHFETRVERIVETSVQNSIGSIMIAMGKEVLASGGNMEAFEARMNKFGEQMEAQMNSKAELLEARGEKLCGSMRAVDAGEEQLKQAVPALESFNFIRVNATNVDIAKSEI